MCEPPCGECAVQRSILSLWGSCAKRVQWTKQRRRGWRSAPVFASAHRGALRKPAKRKRARGKEFLSRVCGQKWVPPGAWSFCDTLNSACTPRKARDRGAMATTKTPSAGGLSIPHSPVFSAPRPDSRGPSRRNAPGGWGGGCCRGCRFHRSCPGRFRPGVSRLCGR